jgi:hypothetical protein
MMAIELFGMSEILGIGIGISEISELIAITFFAYVTWAFMGSYIAFSIIAYIFMLVTNGIAKERIS